MSDDPESMLRPKVSVLLVNYNGGGYVSAVLGSLARQTCRDFEVILVDNASSDGSVDNLTIEGIPRFCLVRSRENLGFAGGNNLAASHASGCWLALLNMDAEAAPDWLERFIEGTENHPDKVVFASAQYTDENQTTIDGAGDAYLIFGFPWRGGYQRSAAEMPSEDSLCFSPCGAGAFFSKTVFEEHGGFDERLFCYCEDVDLGYRLQLAGHDCVLLPAAKIFHSGGKLSGKINEFANFHGIRNRIWVFAKNTPTIWLPLLLPGHIVLSVYLLVRAAMTGRFSVTSRAMWAGLKGSIWIRTRTPWSPPRARSVSLWRLSRSMSWNPFRMSGLQVHIRKLKPPLSPH